MVEIGRKYGPKGVGVVLINSNDARTYPEDRFESMVRRSKDHQYTFPYLHDESQEVAHAYGALVTPHPMLFGPDRKLLFEHALDQALNGEKVQPAELPVAGCSVKWLP